MRQILATISMCRSSLGWAFLSRESGQGLVEYGLILVLIAVVCVGILTLTGQSVSELWYQRIVDALDDIL